MNKQHKHAGRDEDNVTDMNADKDTETYMDMDTNTPTNMDTDPAQHCALGYSDFEL
jgi:hypothetical protein